MTLVCSVGTNWYLPTKCPRSSRNGKHNEHHRAFKCIIQYHLLTLCTFGYYFRIIILTMDREISSWKKTVVLTQKSESLSENFCIIYMPFFPHHQLKQHITLTNVYNDDPEPSRKSYKKQEVCVFFVCLFFWWCVCVWGGINLAEKLP